MVTPMAAAAVKLAAVQLVQDWLKPCGHLLNVSFGFKMWQSESDVPPCSVVIDLEWLGNSLMPRTTHVTQIAAVHVSSQETIEFHVRALASRKAEENKRKKMGICENSNSDEIVQHSLQDCLRNFMSWINNLRNGDEPVCLIAHNGIRYDSPVLINAFSQCNMILPNNIYVLDSLHHVRYYLRHQDALKGFSLDHLANYFDIEVLGETRHKAIYDALLLFRVLTELKNQCDCPFITGMPNKLPTISCMVVRGIGPVVCRALDNIDMRTMCETILMQHGDLKEASCILYLQNQHVKENVPLANISMIASSIADASKRYLQYIE